MGLIIGLGSRAGKAKKGDIIIVSELPDEGIESVFYLVPSTDPKNNDIYDEYMWVMNPDTGVYSWELIGSKQVEVDLSDYPTKQEVTSALQSYANLFKDNVLTGKNTFLDIYITDNYVTETAKQSVQKSVYHLDLNTCHYTLDGINGEILFDYTDTKGVVHNLTLYHNGNLTEATSEKSGLMSKEDKNIIDNSIKVVPISDILMGNILNGTNGKEIYDGVKALIDQYGTVIEEATVLLLNKGSDIISASMLSDGSDDIILKFLFLGMASNTSSLASYYLYIEPDGTVDKEADYFNSVSIINGSSVNFTMDPNTLYVCGEMESLNIGLNTEDNNPKIVNEYMIQFTSGATPTILTLPSNIKWTATPSIAANKTYQISIINNLGVIGEFS